MRAPEAESFCNNMHPSMNKLLLSTFLALSVLFFGAACVTNKAEPVPAASTTTTTTSDSQEVHTY